MGLFPTDDPGYQASFAQESAMIAASELIAGALEASGITQADLARRLKVSRSEITERLRGNRNITVRNLAATLHELGAKLELSATMPRDQASQVVDGYSRWTRAIHTVDDHNERVNRQALAELVGRR